MSDGVRRVAVTGASGYVGRGLTRRLLQDPQIDRILAIDVAAPREATDSRFVFLRHDVSTHLGSTLADNEIDVVVHLAYVLRPGRNREAVRRVNVGGTENLLAACIEAGVSKFVYLSSTSVYGARPDNPAELTEDDAPRPIEGFQYSEDKVQAERLVQEFARGHPDVTATILRCCPVAGPNADNFIARTFRKRFLVAVRGYDPAMQLVHEDDLTEVLALCTLTNVPGLYNVAGEGTIRWSEMAAMLRRRLVALPASVLYPATELAWTLRLQSDSNSAGLDLIRYPWVVSTNKIKRELGVGFRYTARETMDGFMGTLRLANSTFVPGPSSKAPQGDVE